MTTKTCLLAVGCACALAASGMPSQAELQKAQSIVNEVMRSDVAAFNAGKKKAAEVADAALKYAGEAQGESARFLLLKGAFFYRMRAGDYDGAMAVIAQMRREIADVPDKTIASILSSALRRVPRTHCGQLYELLEHTQNRIRYTQEIKELAAKAKAKPSDKAVRTALGEKYALLGDWKAALHEFASGTGPAAEAAALERKASAKPGDVADIWWSLAGTDGSDLSLAYRAHAARFYRAALHGGSLAGLKKTLAEKRIAEAKDEGLPDEPDEATRVSLPRGASNRGAPAASGPRGSGAPAASPVSQGERPKPLVFDLGGGKKLRVQGCPAGTFTMGYEGGDTFYTPHKVTISRPFWVGKFLVTREQWDRFMPPRQLNEREIALGGPWGAVSKVSRKEVDAYCRKLTDRFRSQLPDGYVFRLPTLAEAEYFWRANSTDGNDPYAKPRGLSRQELSMIAVGHEGKQEILRQKGVSWDDSVWRIPALNPTVQVGLRNPNAWGLYDLSGNADTWLLDTFPSGKTADARHGVKLANDLAWQDAVDPLFWSTDGLDGSGLFRDTRLAKGWGVVDVLYAKPGARWGCLGFRLVVGPDLLKERGLGPELGK